MILTFLVTIAAMLSGNTCAAIDTRTQTVVWASYTSSGLSYTRTHYTDSLGYLLFDVEPMQPDVSDALDRLAERYESNTFPPNRIPVECVESLDTGAGVL